jgi:hypothetical protein
MPRNPGGPAWRAAAGSRGLSCKQGADGRTDGAAHLEQEEEEQEEEMEVVEEAEVVSRQAQGV